eukprot:3950375-Prymnesium_polylepis.1
MPSFAVAPSGMAPMVSLAWRVLSCAKRDATLLSASLSSRPRRTRGSSVRCRFGCAALSVAVAVAAAGAEEVAVVGGTGEV